MSVSAGWKPTTVPTAEHSPEPDRELSSKSDIHFEEDLEELLDDRVTVQEKDATVLQSKALDVPKISALRSISNTPRKNRHHFQ